MLLKSFLWSKILSLSDFQYLHNPETITEFQNGGANVNVFPWGNSCDSWEQKLKVICQLILSVRDNSVSSNKFILLVSVIKFIE